ncbi:hypothetical protein GW17_00019028 [Ensete ventricosum]|nr:hypothetical protein GW17_00019028 [Ensete ventricosum]
MIRTQFGDWFIGFDGRQFCTGEYRSVTVNFIHHRPLLGDISLVAVRLGTAREEEGRRKRKRKRKRKRENLKRYRPLIGFFFAAFFAEVRRCLCDRTLAGLSPNHLSTSQ